ncbi:General transcription factor 3C polypeptide 5 [Aspergillus nanangensis]|uniref:General transcription factor 3C polypeptide 5 n=1 Tax=Aspergillus nanangensis TaxID=2582783 RepID=A0AAD4GRZ7_ASPNN|nr:General transcription factor 3C polypeptide 5 [Aspergillus nanangensis]
MPSFLREPNQTQNQLEEDCGSRYAYEDMELVESDESESGGMNEDKAQMTSSGQVRFTGKLVSNMARSVSSEWSTSKKFLGVSPMAIVDYIDEYMQHRPVATRRVLRSVLGHRDQYDIENALPHCGYMFSSGPWKNALIRFGFDPRASTENRVYQTLSFTMEFDPIIESDNHDWAEKGEYAFPQFLEGEDNVAHVFNGKKFVPNGHTWQICDITDPLLRNIISTNELRSEFSSQDGFFWNGTMAKLEVVMQDKLVVIRDGGIPTDDDYTLFLAFPDRFIVKGGRDYERYGLEMGQQYTAKQSYLRGLLVKRAKISP